MSIAATTVFGLVLAFLAAFGPAQAGSASTVRSVSHPHCGTSVNLVPHCGRWWGVAPLAYENKPLKTALPQEENYAGRNLDIVHTYHVNTQLFPNAAERSVAHQRGHNRLLLINWKPATDMTWRKVAQGHADSRIDREANYIKHNFRHHFFLAIWHEPENDVNEHSGSGMTATDYAAMYRHVVSRLRHDGVTWTVNVMNFMGFVNWAQKSWFKQLYPGNSYVNWVGIDPYGTGAAKSNYLPKNFPTLVNGHYGTNFPGFYTYLQRHYHSKPIMLCEWGVGANPKNPNGQASFFHSVQSTVSHYPALKALVYFDMPKPPDRTGPRTYLAATSNTLNAYRALGRSKPIVAPLIKY
jgi:hypothetical protein